MDLQGDLFSHGCHESVNPKTVNRRNTGEVFHMENDEKDGEKHAAALESPAQCLGLRVEGLGVVV